MSEWSIVINNKIIKSFSLLDGEKKTIGRSSEADITIDNQAISRLHIAIEATAGIYLVSDLGSKNGSFVNGAKITANEPVSNTDTIEFGKFILQHSSETTAGASVADSVSVDSMDLDEETVFVTGKGSGPIGQKSFTPRSSSCSLTLLGGNATPNKLEIGNKNSIKIGKDNTCDMVVPGFFVAKAQCYIFKKGDNYILVPQKSWVGTFINNVKVTGERNLRKGDVIKIRATSIRFNQ